ncbi:MAG: L-seryl-tRNA(Sec) selenium transferase [Deltaproteobacteria bacterium]|nr:L-seryl-tRNA(Sec) selenium transferase [Deltaproteobacteria bacterium]
MSLSQLPSMTKLLKDPRLAALPHALAKRAAKQVVDEARTIVLGGGPLPDDLPGRAADRAALLQVGALRRVINATGIVIHTNLGRAPMAQEVVDAVGAVAGGYANLEMVLSTGGRGGRLAGVIEHTLALTGAEAAIAVNNNAAAVMICLTALASGKDVLVSRGELVEIGGSFRVPEIVAAGGARLVEVGTTNRTRTADFANAITDQTALILRVHPANFKQIGFIERAPREELVALGRERNIPVVEDLGSGLLGSPMSLAGEPMPSDSDEPVDSVVRSGMDLVCFSGDKLLGGPQSGIVVGRADLVSKLRKHPMYRAMRLDKMSLVALETTLRMIREGRESDIPVRSMMARTVEDCRVIGEQIAARVPGATLEEDVGFSGGGALPGTGLRTTVVAIRGGDIEAWAAQLRRGETPVVARVARDALIVDPRTLLPGDVDRLIDCLNGVIGAD